MTLRPTLVLLSLLIAATSVEPFFFKLPFFDLSPFIPQPFGPQQPDIPPPPENDVGPGSNTGYNGGWELLSENAGVSAMHLVIMPTNKAIMFDSFVYGPSQIKLADGNCRMTKKGVEDCWAHAVEYDIATNVVRPLKLFTDTWCSAGGLAPDGTLVNSGGWFDGGRSVRFLTPCNTCDWQEYPTALAPGQRWYATQQMLANGSFVVVGGRRAFSYEFVPTAGKSNSAVINLPFLRETTDKVENNLYPFVHLVPDGNLFIFANNRSFLLEPTTGQVITEYPVLSGGSRNYPASAMSALLPLDLRKKKTPRAEVLICGGAQHDAFDLAENGTFPPALRSCGRMGINKRNPQWAMEDMPMERVMGDMLLLPTGDVLIINGARNGSAGWRFARDPVFEPLLYRPTSPKGQRFSTLAKTQIPRMYHSSSAVLPDASVMVAGSNTNSGYNFTGVLFPTELRVEKFYPPYLDPMLKSRRPTIDAGTVAATVGYGQMLDIEFTVEEFEVKRDEVMVTMYAPPFTTHGFSQGQRLLILKTKDLEGSGFQRTKITVMTPPNGKLAPPGYYLLFVVNRGVPSSAVWVRIQ